MRADGIVVIHPALRDDLVAEGLPADSILVEPDGVREAPSTPPDRDAARRELGLPSDIRLVVYTGHLYPAKGVDVLARAVSRLADAEGVVVGGMDDDRARLEVLLRDEGIENVRLVPHVPPERARLHQVAADVLALPTRALGENARRYTSPLKLAEYRAAGRPIVATDLPSTRAWLTDGENARLVPPDDPAAMAAAIDDLLRDPGTGRRLAARAREGLEADTWRARAERILAFAASRTESRP
jgi:glycosyltransferase involved in cell wall biosynthesis